jgi:hypothetical protein
VDSLYDLGWRQGTIFRGTIEAAVVGRKTTTFDRWVVCDQECDLTNASSDSDEVLVEIRPVLSVNNPSDWGIRSRRLRLTESTHVDHAMPKVQITAHALAQLASNIEEIPNDDRQRAFKTWLGLRYDRPAIPEPLVDFAREIAKRCGARSARDVSLDVHEILMQFREDTHPPQAALYAIVTDAADVQRVKLWLADAATRIDASLGVIARIEVQTRSQTSIELVEKSYAADLTQLT